MRTRGKARLLWLLLASMVGIAWNREAFLLETDPGGAARTALYLPLVTSGHGPSLSFMLRSDAGVDGGSLPAEYTCDGPGFSPALTWANAPAGTREFALMMTTIPVDGQTKWSWVLYGLPAAATGLAKNSTGVGIPGAGSRGTLAYEPPCSQGPGAKVYTFTVYALSGTPTLPSAATLVTGEVLTAAISPLRLGSASLNLSYARPQ